MKAISHDTLAASGLMPLPPLRPSRRNPSALISWISSALSICKSSRHIPRPLIEWFSHASQWYRRLSTQLSTRDRQYAGPMQQQQQQQQPPWEFLAVAKTLLFCHTASSIRAEISRESDDHWTTVFQGQVCLRRKGPAYSSTYGVLVPGHGCYCMDLDNEEVFAHEEKWDRAGNYEFGVWLSDELWISLKWSNADIVDALHQPHFQQLFLQQTSRCMDNMLPSLSICWEQLKQMQDV